MQFSFFFFPWRKQAFYFCHKSGCWKPCADPCRPITLRSFLIAVSSRGVWDPHLLTVLCSMRSQVKNKRYWWYDHRQMPVTQVKPNWFVKPARFSLSIAVVKYTPCFILSFSEISKYICMLQFTLVLCFLLFSQVHMLILMWFDI